MVFVKIPEVVSFLTNRTIFRNRFWIKTKIRTCVPAIFVLYYISERRKHVFRCRLGWFFLLIFENIG